MSLQAMAWAWEQNVPGSPSKKLVLLALADTANHDGLCWPSCGWIAQRAGIGEDQVRKIIVKLVSDGLVEKVERRRRSNGTLGVWVYRVPLATGSSDPIDHRVSGSRDPVDHRVERPGQEPKVNLEPKTTPRPSSSELAKTANSPEEGPAPQTNGAVERIYNHWRSARAKTRASYDTISEARRRKIEVRLREFSEEDLLRAIDGIGCDPWPDRHLHDDLLKVFRSREQVEKFLDLAERRPLPGRGLSAQEIADLDLEGMLGR